MRFLLFFTPLIFFGCASAPAVPDDAGAETFVIERDLVGSMVARGEFSAITGLQRGFSAELTGTWDGRTYQLNEKFTYDDGERDEKTWVLRPNGDGTYSGVREDVVGEAKGWQDGKHFRLAYDVRLPNDKGEPGMKVRFQDVMALTPTGTVVNHATVGKWGFWIGKVELTIDRANSQKR